MITVALVFGLMAISEVPGLIRRRLWGELVVFTFFWLAGLALTALLTAGRPIPNPNHAVEAAVEEVDRFFRGLLR